MIVFLWAVSALGSLLILQTAFARSVAKASMLITGSIRLGEVVYAVIFFPGVIIHELSHFFMAGLLGVRTGPLEIFPRESKEGLRLGSVKVSRADFLRNACIGAAPLLVGLILLMILSRLMFTFPLEPESLRVIGETIVSNFSLKTALYLYGPFAISNTMALSKSDREGLFPTLAILIALGLAAIWSPTTSSVIETVITELQQIVNSFAVGLTFVVILNLLCLLPLYLAVKMLEWATRKKYG